MNNITSLQAISSGQGSLSRIDERQKVALQRIASVAEQAGGTLPSDSVTNTQPAPDTRLRDAEVTLARTSTILQAARQTLGQAEQLLGSGGDTAEMLSALDDLVRSARFEGQPLFDGSRAAAPREIALQVSDDGATASIVLPDLRSIELFGDGIPSDDALYEVLKWIRAGGTQLRELDQAVDQIGAYVDTVRQNRIAASSELTADDLAAAQPVQAASRQVAEASAVAGAVQGSRLQPAVLDLIG